MFIMFTAALFIINCPKLETTQMFPSICERFNELCSIYGILLNNNKEQKKNEKIRTTTKNNKEQICNNLDEPPDLNWLKKANPQRLHTIWFYFSFLKWQNYRNWEQSSCQGLEVGGNRREVGMAIKGNGRGPCGDRNVLYLGCNKISVSKMWYCTSLARCHHWGKL